MDQRCLVVPNDNDIMQERKEGRQEKMYFPSRGTPHTEAWLAKGNNHTSAVIGMYMYRGVPQIIDEEEEEIAFTQIRQIFNV
eukprot:gene11877-8163_t